MSGGVDEETLKIILEIFFFPNMAAVLQKWNSGKTIEKNRFKSQIRIVG